MILGIGTSPGALVVAALAGFSAAVAAFIYARHAVIFLTAVAGAAQACFFTASVIVGGPGALWRAMARSIPLTAVLVCLVGLLALAGMYCQSRLGGVLRISLAPEAPAGRKGRRSRGVVRPRLTKS